MIAVKTNNSLRSKQLLNLAANYYFNSISHCYFSGLKFFGFHDNVFINALFSIRSFDIRLYTFIDVAIIFMPATRKIKGYKTMKTPKFFTVVAAATFALVASTITAFAVPATAISAVNVRSGPGVSFAKIDALHAGQAVNVTECQGGWCYVEKTGPDGWVSGNFLQATEEAAAAPAPAPNNAANDAAAAAAINVFGTILGAIINNAAPPPAAPPPAPVPPAEVQLNGVYTIVQKSTGRYLDAHTSEANDWNVVTRPRQFNATQAWIITPLGGGIFTLQQQSNGRYLDAHTSEAKDWSAVTRPIQNNNTQRWILTSLGNDTYTIQQNNNGRYLDAHTSEANDWSAVTRTSQNNNTQRWIIK